MFLIFAQIHSKSKQWISNEWILNPFISNSSVWAQPKSSWHIDINITICLHYIEILYINYNINLFICHQELYYFAKIWLGYFGKLKISRIFLSYLCFSRSIYVCMHSLTPWLSILWEINFSYASISVWYLCHLLQMTIFDHWLLCLQYFVCSSSLNFF